MGRAEKVDIDIESTGDTSAGENPHTHPQHHPGGEWELRGKEEERGRSEHHHLREDHLRSPAAGRKAIPWKAKSRRRGVVKDGLVQSRLENFVRNYPNLSIRGGGSVIVGESSEGGNNGSAIRRGVKRVSSDL